MTNLTPAQNITQGFPRLLRPLVSSCLHSANLKPVTDLLPKAKEQTHLAEAFYCTVKAVLCEPELLPRSIFPSKAAYLCYRCARFFFLCVNALSCRSAKTDRQFAKDKIALLKGNETVVDILNAIKPHIESLKTNLAKDLQRPHNRGVIQGKITFILDTLHLDVEREEISKMVNWIKDNKALSQNMCMLIAELLG